MAAHPSTPIPLSPIHRAAADVVARRGDGTVRAEDLKVSTPPKPELGDVAVACFQVAKGSNPAKVAAEIAAAFQPEGLLASATATGPYVNFKVDRAAALRWIVGEALAGRLVPQLGAGKTICIDYSSPNISKELAFHHIRSTGIGHAIAQIDRALGYRVVGINHLGDWGTTHGMLIDAWLKWGTDVAPEAIDLDIKELNALYVRWRDAANVLKDERADKWVGMLAAGGADREVALKELTEARAKAQAHEDGGRAWFARLESGDARARAIWERFRAISWADFEDIYRQLGIVFEEVRGEAAYEPDLPGVMAELREKGLVHESEGAQVVDLPDEKIPVIVAKRDGASTYATRDFASAKYRHATHGFERSLYVVAREQALHFRQVFKLLGRAGYAWASQCEHVSFGLVRLGGKKSSTRAGGAVLLRDVLKEAQARALAKMAEDPTSESAKLPLGVALPLAAQVGIGAVLFANLVTQREKDIDFEWDRALAAEGDSGVYLQYTHARCASIMRRGGVALGEALGDGVDFARLVEAHEWAVAKRLLDYGEVVARAGAQNEPHLVCHYLLELAGDFSRWYTAGNSKDAAHLRVLCDDAELRRARLALVGAVQRTLADGLGLLGIAAPDQM